MPRTITAHHQWVIAATIDVDERIARKGHQRGVVRMPDGLTIDVMETYCAMCRKTYEDISDAPCSAAASTEHLRGGPIGVRAKRNGSAVAAAPVIEQPPITHPVTRPATRPAAQLQPVLRPVPTARRASRRRPLPQPAAQMMLFDLDATLTG